MPRQSALTYGEGWFAEEQHQSRPFRWMGREGRCRITGLPPAAPALLRVTGGMWSNRAETPALSVTVNGRPAGTTTVSADVGHCVFPIESSDCLDIELALDRTFSVPGDGRSLGLMVRALEVLVADELEQPLDADGWLEWEHYEYFPFRWMGQTARLVVPPSLRARGRFAQLPVSSDCDDGEQVLSVLAGDAGPSAVGPASVPADRVLATLRLLRGWHVYEIPLGPAADGVRDNDILWLRFHLNRLAPPETHPDDGRALGVRVGPLTIHDDRRRHEYVRRFHAAAQGATTGHGERLLRLPGDGSDARSVDSGCRSLPVEGDGWFAIEYDDDGPFRWMGREARLRLTAAMRGLGRYCVIPIFSSFRNLTQEVTILAGNRELLSIPLLKAWNTYSLELPSPADEDLVLTLRVNKIPPLASHEDDPRPLGIRLGDIRFHDDPARHQRQELMYENAVRNQQELQEGASVLRSFPLMLGIDLYGKCNIKPACVYCLWDPMKALEGEHVDTPIDDRTLESYGEFFRGVKRVVNCSFGEPLLHPRLEPILDFLAANGKMAEISSNGQAFTARTIRALEGKPIYLYVSLDSATAETYGRLRNDRWHEIVTGLLFLRDARRRGHGWPRLNLVFMPMKANRQDVEMYFKLCRLVEADQMVLRPLLQLEDPGIERDRGGYHFDYEKELLGRQDLEEIFEECGRHARAYGVRVISQFDFGRIDAPTIGEGRGAA